jgi:hypothetical protein
VYEFNGPIAGTYPPSYDPSYWNEGRRVQFRLTAQLKTIAHHVPPVAEMLVVAQPSLTAGLLFFLFWNFSGFVGALWKRWDLLTVSLAIPGLYMLVHLETRFVGSFVVLLWLTAFMAVRLPAGKDAQRIAGASAAALMVAMLLSFASNTAKKVLKECPDSIEDQLAMAEQLPIPQGTAIAVIGYGNEAYWAHFARLRIVAEVLEPAGRTTAGNLRGFPEGWSAADCWGAARAGRGCAMGAGRHDNIFPVCIGPVGKLRARPFDFSSFP